MRSLPELFENNRTWAEQIVKRNPDFFKELSQQQSPRYLWIGCSDSRVPANQIIGLPPGEVFVHRNIANLVVHSDLNCLSVMQFAIDALKVEHIMVVGHYGCGGVRAVLRQDRIGLSDNWLRHLQDVRERHPNRLDPLCPESHQVDRLCELNVIEQVRNVSRTTIVRDAWERGQKLTLHGWVYGLKDGLLRDMGVTGSSPHEIAEVYGEALASLG
jgi:carbonic anhydrase